MSTSMATISRGVVRKALATRGSASNPLPHVFPSFIHHSEYFAVAMQNHASYFLHRRLSGQATQFQPHSQTLSSALDGYHLGNSSSNNCIQDQLRLANAHPLPKCHLTTEDVSKILRFVHLDSVRRKLREIPDACISNNQLLEICVDCTDKSKGIEIINSLEKSGTILRIGETVYLQPEQVVRYIQSVLPLYVDDSCREELRKLETEKAEIDMETERLVRKELWCGLGVFGLQMAALFRLTFWEFSWDVMEPICFFLTSLNCLMGYAFFMKTAREPTFESFYAACFKIKQHKQMKKRHFNIERYKQLQRLR